MSISTFEECLKNVLSQLSDGTFEERLTNVLSRLSNSGLKTRKIESHILHIKWNFFTHVKQIHSLTEFHGGGMSNWLLWQYKKVLWQLKKVKTNTKTLGEARRTVSQQGSSVRYGLFFLTKNWMHLKKPMDFCTQSRMAARGRDARWNTRKIFGVSNIKTKYTT